ncbi:Peptidase M20, dimerisation domain [Phaffia rhodozyma]|uniref:Peptidase M20, dimerisation domain n=1 Tax=Phaffia rhodozyma TaxID=264483 RepID=A0A0F7SF20_PHARH|nr:Peptidase M20, dimerisation domain [Phaffia rhodozyma]
MRSKSPVPSCFSFLRSSSSRVQSPDPSSVPSSSPVARRAVDEKVTEDDALPAYFADSMNLDSDDGLNDRALETIQSAIDFYSADLREISLFISDHPELSYHEFLAHDHITSFLSKQGFDVTKSYVIPTAFKASFTLNFKSGSLGKNGRHVGFCSEYDALPGIGNACGHNLIAIGGIAALLATRAAMKAYRISGTVTLFGTPAEEGGGGKIELIKAGAFKDLDACLMVHPTAGGKKGEKGTAIITGTLAVQQFKVQYFGKTAHAALAPWEGINALDAAVQAYSSIAMLRQQLNPSVRVHGIILQGGLVPNVIPDHTLMKWCARTQSAKELDTLMAKLIDCFKAAALSTGCSYEIKMDGPAYSELRCNLPLSQAFAKVLSKMYDIPVKIDIDRFEGASTDFGNITYEVPACHPDYTIPSRLGDQNHTIGFTEAARTKQAHEDTLRMSAGLAGVGIRVLEDEAFAKEAKTWFNNNTKT